MKDFAGRLAVITGAGTGMGRELARQLASAGCHLALCDLLMDNLEQTQALCVQAAPAGTRVSVSECDVSKEERVMAFRDDVKREHRSEHINLLFNNAGIGGGGSFIHEPREDWDRTFGVCWGGVYNCTRAFMPMLIASDAGHIINTSSVNGFWACLGPNNAHTAYSAAKFAVKGFTEALIVDTRLHAPHVKVSLVMPGHIGTSIVENSQKLLRDRSISEMNAEDLAPWRERMARQGMPTKDMSDDAVRAGLQTLSDTFRDKAPMTASQAAEVILTGVREERWRILVGNDAHDLDAAVRAAPEEAYDVAFAVKVYQLGNMRAAGNR
jgi:NAD(P)-dependent dehydrogenase (short-subunit alcohol dehydrogenase family)